MRAAIGYSLGDEPIGLARLREKYAAKMADAPDRRAFDVVSAPVGTASAEFQDVAKKIAGVDTLDTFLRDMRTRYPDSAAISPGAADKAAPPAAPAKPKEPAAQAATPEKAAVNAPAKPDARRAAESAGQARSIADRVDFASDAARALSVER